MKHKTQHPGAESSQTATKESLRGGLPRLKPFIRRLRNHRRDLALVIGMMCITIATTLIIPLALGHLVNTFSNATEGLSMRPDRWGWLLGGLLVVQFVTSYWSAVVSARLDLGYTARLRKRLMEHLLDLPSLFFTKQKAGDLSTRMTSDIGSITYIVIGGSVSLLRTVITLIGALVIMLNMNSRLTLVILAVVPLTVILVQLFGRRLRRLSRRMYDELGKISSHVQEVAGAIRIIKVYNTQRHECGRYNEMVENYEDAGRRRAITGALLESCVQILLWLCLITVVAYSFYLIARGDMNNGELSAFLLYAMRVTGLLSSLTNLYASGQGAVAAAGRLDTIFSTTPENGLGGPATPTIACEGALRLEKVGFGYEEQRVLDGVDLDIPAGQWWGIVGPSGAGKTTLTGLIMRLFDPEEGRLLLDGKPYGDYDIAALRGQMAYVSQDPVLYDASIADNIRFGLADCTEEEIRRAATRANALDFIEALPAGFDTVVGERGVRLSGGERQRITLARAFLRNPRILILDEPTSALDAHSEQAVHEALAALMKGRTTIVVAHRFSLVRNLDRIVVLADGRVAESGSHAELMATGGLYQTLYNLQHEE